MKSIGSRILIAVSGVMIAQPGLAQKSGQSMQIQHGIVVSSSYVQEKSDAGKAALVGGAVGYGLQRNKSTGRKLTATAVGAGVAGSARSRSEGSREARQYEVRTGTGIVLIISDQTEIQVNDCVLVENPGNSNANIRRVDDAMCEPESADVVAELQDELLDDAKQCADAKRELSAADTDASFDRAFRKVEILCNT